MPKELARRLRQILLHELPCLQALAKQQTAVEPPPSGAWSEKQELGHLIDSAANNHIRFVRAGTVTSARESSLHFDSYAQNAWVELHAYQEMEWAPLIDFWHSYNNFLAGLIERIPADRLAVTCAVGSDPPATLEFLIGDYMVHMQHHLDHLLHRPIVTRYPQQTA